MNSLWYWPTQGDINDIPDPLGIEDQWFPWAGTMEEGPPVFAEIFAREYIQNSWDSIQQKSEALGNKKGGTRAAASISFHFEELKGKAATRFAKNFGLFDHVERLKIMDSDQLRGLLHDPVTSSVRQQRFVGS